jgi:hypothetical protein
MTSATRHTPAATPPDTHASIAEPVALADQLGVVSVYVDERGAGPPPGADAIRGLLGEPTPTGPSDSLPAFERSVAALETRLAAVPEGSARALFAGIASQRIIEVPLAAPVDPYVALDRFAHVRPLMRAVDRMRPAGLVVLHGGRFELLEIAGTALTQLRTVDVAAAEDEWLRRRGGPGAPSGPARQPGNWRDRHVRRRRHRVDRLTARFADHVATVARLRGWDVVVSTGNRRLMAAFARRFAGTQPELVELRPALSRLSRRALAQQAHDRAVSFRRARTLARAGDIVESPATIWGVEPVLDALDGGRVEHVLIADDLADESAERLLRRALATGAQLTLLDAGALGPLGVAGGPRW